MQAAVLGISSDSKPKQRLWIALLWIHLIINWFFLIQSRKDPLFLTWTIGHKDDPNSTFHVWNNNSTVGTNARFHFGNPDPKFSRILGFLSHLRWKMWVPLALKPSAIYLDDFPQFVAFASHHGRSRLRRSNHYLPRGYDPNCRLSFHIVHDDQQSLWEPAKRLKVGLRV